MVTHSGDGGFGSAFFGLPSATDRSESADDTDSDDDDSDSAHNKSDKSSTDTPPKGSQATNSGDDDSDENNSGDSDSDGPDGTDAHESTADSTESAGGASVSNTVDGTDVGGGITYNGHTVNSTESGDDDPIVSPGAPSGGAINSTAGDEATSEPAGGDTASSHGYISGTVTDDSISGTVYGVSGTVTDEGVTSTGSAPRTSPLPDLPVPQPSPMPRTAPVPDLPVPRTSPAPRTAPRRDTPHPAPKRSAPHVAGDTATTGSAGGGHADTAPALRCTRMVPDQQALRAAIATATPHEVICLRSTGPVRPDPLDTTGTPKKRPPASTDVTITPVPSAEPPTAARTDAGSGTR